jgi:hypothetical protein
LPARCILARPTRLARPKAPRSPSTTHAEPGRLVTRLKHQADGQGAKITRYQVERGGTWTLADLEPGGYDRERQLRQHGAARRCHICKKEARAQRGQRRTSTRRGGRRRIRSRRVTVQ